MQYDQREYQRYKQYCGTYYYTLSICSTTFCEDTGDRSLRVDIITCLHSRAHLHQYRQDKDFKDVHTSAL